MSKFLSLEIATAVAEYDMRCRAFAGKKAPGQWPYLPRVSQKKRRLNDRRTRG